MNIHFIHSNQNMRILLTQRTVAAAANEPSPLPKVELTGMGDYLADQANQAGAEAAGLIQRIQPVQTEIARLQDSVKQKRDLAAKLAPMEM
jgi:hypothetical protein